jgi:phosphoglycerate dehydrogenase-like enzyme
MIAGAGLDVTDPEPLPSGHPLLLLDNVVFSPHRACSTVGTLEKMADVSIENLRRGLFGLPLLAQCN